MSRVGRQPIPIPDAVTVSIDTSSGAADVTVKGPKGQLTTALPQPITAAEEDGTVVVDRPDDTKDSRARHGLSRALVANMVEGVTEGFKRELEIVGVGYRAIAKGPSKLELQLGFSHPVTVEAPDGIAFEIPSQTEIIVTGIDKQRVGQVAADLRALRPPEPYKGKGVRYKDERVRRKAGKAGAA